MLETIIGQAPEGAFLGVRRDGARWVLSLDLPQEAGGWEVSAATPGEAAALLRGLWEGHEKGGGGVVSPDTHALPEIKIRTGKPKG